VNYSDSYFNNEKRKEKEWKKEHTAGGFKCAHCKQWVVINSSMGTLNRNHCNSCLWSKHVDEQKGDRKSGCNSGMRPIGLTFKHEGWGRQGEIMVIHECSLCTKISINRIASDDMNDGILALFEASLTLKNRFTKEDIYVLQEEDRHEVRVQLFGKR
jgi:hypothetical protein